MSKYIIIPEGCRWSTQSAADAKTAYCLICSWYSPETRTAVLDPETGETRIFTRVLDPAGNLKKVIEHHTLDA